MNVSIFEFSVENYKIFKNKVTFSTVARKSKHAFGLKDENLLKTSLIYGPNSSGKTSLLDALRVMKNVVKNSANSENALELPYSPFLLSDNSSEPTTWEIALSLDESIFKYSFSIVENEVVSEKLSEVVSDKSEKDYLKREYQDIELFYEFKDSSDIIQKTRKETLFISAAAQWNSNLALRIVQAFSKINVIRGVESEYLNYTANMIKKKSENKLKILNILKKADFSINDILLEKIDLPEELIKKIKNLSDSENTKVPATVDMFMLSHMKYDNQNKAIGLENIPLNNESQGTKSFLSLLGPIVDTLENGKVLFIDEFDNSLHPLLTRFIINLFEKNNPNNAQLIVTTHDTSLLSNRCDLNKEQVWFTEKNSQGAANLFSLSEFNLRNDTEYSKKYLEGRFGALPTIEMY